MTSLNQTAWPALTALVSFAGICWLYFSLWRPYRVDYLRDRLFSLRDELFDMALRGDVSFSDPAYGMLRSVINGTIRYAHRVEFLDFVAYVLLARRDPVCRECVEQFERGWAGALSSISPGARLTLQGIRTRLHVLVVDQVVAVSPVLLVMVVPIVLWLVTMQLGSRALQVCRRVLGAARVTSFANQFDSAALSGTEDWPRRATV